MIKKINFNWIKWTQVNKNVGKSTWAIKIMFFGSFWGFGPGLDPKE